MQVNQPQQESQSQAVSTNTSAQGTEVYTPEVDVMETAESYILDVYMPGVSDKTAEATLENDVLTVRGQVERSPQDSLRLAYQEYEVGDYRQLFTVSDDIDRDRVSATVRDGVIHLVLPKSERYKAKRIAVKAA